MTYQSQVVKRIIPQLKRTLEIERSAREDASALGDEKIRELEGKLATVICPRCGESMEMEANAQVASLIVQRDFLQDPLAQAEARLCAATNLVNRLTVNVAVLEEIVSSKDLLLPKNYDVDLVAESNQWLEDAEPCSHEARAREVEERNERLTKALEKLLERLKNGK